MLRSVATPHDKNLTWRGIVIHNQNLGPSELETSLKVDMKSRFANNKVVSCLQLHAMMSHVLGIILILRSLSSTHGKATLPIF